MRAAQDVFSTGSARRRRGDGHDADLPGGGTRAGMDGAQALYARSGFRPIDNPMGGTGHFSCDRFFILDL
jgi:hypothetical protein